MSRISFLSSGRAWSEFGICFPPAHHFLVRKPLKWIFPYSTFSLQVGREGEEAGAEREEGGVRISSTLRCSRNSESGQQGLTSPPHPPFWTTPLAAFAENRAPLHEVGYHQPFCRIFMHFWGVRSPAFARFPVVQ